MLVSAFVARVNYILRGTEDDAPNEGSDEWSYWVDTLNRKKDELYYDVAKSWSSAYAETAVGTTVSVSSAPSYNLSATFLAPSNGIYIIDTNGVRHDIELVQPFEKSIYTRQAYIAGMNPQVLRLSTAVVTGEDIVGGTIYVPGYYLPADVDQDSDTVPLPDPNWGAMAVAAEIAFNDITYEDKAPDIQGKANALFSQMVARNRRGTYAKPRKSAYNVRRIPGTDVR